MYPFLESEVRKGRWHTLVQSKPNVDSRVDGEGGEELGPGNWRWNHRLKTVIVPGSGKAHHNRLDWEGGDK